MGEFRVSTIAQESWKAKLKRISGCAYLLSASLDPVRYMIQIGPNMPSEPAILCLKMFVDDVWMGNRACIWFIKGCDKVK